MSGDLVYTDVVAFGVQGDTNIEIQTDKNDSGASTSTDCGATVLEILKIVVKSKFSATNGAITYETVVNAVAGEGTLAAYAQLQHLHLILMIF